MSDLQQVIQRAKADIAKQYVFVHMPIPQLETLLAGLEEAQRKIDRLKTENQRIVDWANDKIYGLEAEHTTMKEAMKTLVENYEVQEAWDAIFSVYAELFPSEEESNEPN